MTKFTKGEIDFLNHRLALPDCLSEVLSDNEDDLVASGFENVERECTRFQAMIENNTVENLLADMTPLRRAILRDVVEGSTFVACYPTDHPDADAPRRAAVRVARSAASKLRAAGFDCGNAPEF
jgi:hypothetical protein